MSDTKKSSLKKKLIVRFNSLQHVTVKRARTDSALMVPDKVPPKQLNVSVDVVKLVVDYIREHGKDEIGIFRLSGRSAQAALLKSDFVKEIVSLPAPDSSIEVIHTVATAFKGYLTELTEPLTLYENYQTLLGVVDSKSKQSTEQRIETIKGIIENLPVNEYAALKVITNLLVTISNSPTTKMTIENCAIVFGTIFLRPREFTREFVFQVPLQCQVVEILIGQYATIFENDKGSNIIFKPLSTEHSAEEEELETEHLIENKPPPSLETENDLDFTFKKSETAPKLEHKWESTKSKASPFCSHCREIITPPKKKRRAVFFSCQVCDVPVHEKCREFATYGCQGKKTSLESVLNKVTVGSIAPDIPNLKKNDDGSFSSLHELANNGVKVILFFYPKSFTPLCTKQNICFRDNIKYFHYSNCEVVGVSADSKGCHKKFAQVYKLPFTLKSDKKDLIRKAYGVPASFGGYVPGRVTYVIAPYSKKILFIHNSSMTATDHVAACLNVVSKLLEHEAKTGGFPIDDLDLEGF